MLDFFRQVSSTIASSNSDPEDADVENGASPSSPTNVLQDRAGIIVLREDLDFYVIPPRRDITHPDMISVKRNAGKVLLKQDGIFSGLRRTDDAGTTEQHLIEMLTAGLNSYLISSLLPPLLVYSSIPNLLDCLIVDSIRMTGGGTELANRTKQSSVVLPSPGLGLT